MLYLFARLKEEISRAKSKKSGLGIIMIDIDNFKNINDTHGHRVGDIVLKRLAKILLQLIGDSGNMVSRFGGEEFVGFLVECDKKHLIEVAESIRETVENTIVSFRRKKIVFTVSAGAVMYPDDGEDILELIDNVDHLLYKAKREGKNRVCFIKRKKK
ncbi:MAG: GGDEF domain-containing protein [Candidatus Omnitrophica bacterium]|nr:GGDEF domain-containing protein [Candidatus Omnitrophota bacterium]